MLAYRFPLLAAALAAALLCACATPVAGAGGSDPPLQLIAETAADGPSSAEFARRAAQLAGVPVRDVRMVTPRRFALTLECGGAVACAEARRRLTSDPSFILDTQIDERRMLPRPPTASPSR